ncbi:MAG: efflux RND transporter periplasmic adaptor subunit [Pseudomonadota bacterium]
MTEQTTESRPSWLWIAVGAGALGLGILVYSAAGAASTVSAPDGGAARSDLAPVVEFALIEPTERTFMVTAPGRLEARQTLSVVGEVPGKISEIHPNLELGGRIHEGEILFRIDQGDYRADLNRAEAQLSTALASLDQAQANRDRQVELAEIGAVPAAQEEAAVASFANAEANVAQARAQVTLARRNLSKTSVRAPFDAIVVSETLSPDTYVAPGAPLANLIDASAGEIRAGLSPRDVASVRRAQEAANGGEITVRAVPNDASIGNLTLTGTLASFAPTIDPTSRTVSVRAVFPDAFSLANQGRTFTGDFMTLEIAAQSDQPIYSLPTAALRREHEAWLITSDNELRAVEVAPLETRGAETLVTSPSDLSGQRVLTTPLAEETDGMTVRPRSAFAVDSE